MMSFELIYALKHFTPSCWAYLEADYKLIVLCYVICTWLNKWESLGEYPFVRRYLYHPLLLKLFFTPLKNSCEACSLETALDLNKLCFWRSKSFNVFQLTARNKNTLQPPTRNGSCNIFSPVWEWGVVICPNLLWVLGYQLSKIVFWDCWCRSRSSCSFDPIEIYTLMVLYDICFVFRLHVWPYFLLVVRLASCSKLS